MTAVPRRRLDTVLGHRVRRRGRPECRSSRRRGLRIASPATVERLREADLAGRFVKAVDELLFGGRALCTAGERWVGSQRHAVVCETMRVSTESSGRDP
jgi:hypothetical protein